MNVDNVEVEVEVEDNTIDEASDNSLFEEDGSHFEGNNEVEVSFDEAEEQSSVTYEENLDEENTEQSSEEEQQDNSEEEKVLSEVEQLRQELDQLKAEKERSQFFEKFGSESEYNELVEWSSKNLPEDLIDGYNDLISKDNLTVDMQYALANLLRSHKELHTKQSKSKASTDERMLVGSPQVSNNDSTPLVSVDDIESAISNPLYGDMSPEGIAYTKKVNSRTGIGMSIR